MQTPNNPFVLSGYYGKKWFCNREAELAELQQHMGNDRNVVVYAWRRLGKTALIKYLFELAKQQKKHDCIYVDLLATTGTQDVIRTITQAIHNQYGKTKNGLNTHFQKMLAAIGVSISFNQVTGNPELSFGLQSAPLPDRSLQVLGEFLTQRNATVWLALDEFQQIASFEGQAEALFRDWAQSYPSIRFIYSGSHRTIMEAMFTEQKRPFYQSAQLIELGPIEIETYQSFIQGHFIEHNKKIDTDAIHALYQWSRGQTYSIQRICNYLFGSYDKCGMHEVSETYHKIIDQEKAILANFQKILSSTQWKILKAIAKSEPLINPFNKTFIRQYDLGTPSTVNTALKTLIKKEVVVEDKGKYLVHDVILARWLQSL